MRFNDAQPIATRLLGSLAGACDRIEIAGSIRRHRADVKDIELVAIPKWHDQPHVGVQIGLEAVLPTQRVNILAVAIQAYVDAGALQVIKPSVPGIEPGELRQDARYLRLYIPSRGLKVDLFMCDVDTWGCTFLYRTGAADFSKAMLARWKQVSGGGQSRDSRLYRPGALSAESTPEETDVFAACQVAFLQPHERTDASVVHRYALQGAPR